MIEAKLVTHEDHESLSKKVAILEAKLSSLLEGRQTEKRKDFLSVKDFIQEIGVSRTTFENMRRESHPRRFKVNVITRGGKIYVPAKEIDRFFSKTE